MKLLEYIIPVAHAQIDPNAGGSLGKSSFTLGDFNFLNPIKSTDAASKFNSIFGTIVGLVLTIAAIVAFFYLIIAGFQYITAGGDAAKAQAARQGIVNALIGIIIILLAYLILRYVGTSIIS